MARLVNDKRGAVTVQIALFLPILIIILVGAFEVWKIMYLQQVLNDAAYQGVRLLVTQARAPQIEGVDERHMRDEAAAMIRRYVATQAFAPIPDSALGDEDTGILPGGPITVDDAYHVYDIASMITVDISPIDTWPPVCGQQVAVRVGRPWTVGRGIRANKSGWMTFLEDSGWLYGQASGVVQCEREEDVYGEP